MELEPDRHARDARGERDYARPRRPTRGVRQPWRMSAVGSAAGYTGFGGPGWSTGGFGDPGYNTSGFDSPDYGASRTGASGANDFIASRWGHDRYGDYGIDVTPAAPRRESVGERPEPGYRGVGPRGFQRSDDRIGEQVCMLLTDDPQVDASEIEVEVKGGEVTLSGTVPDREMKWLAEDLAETVPGVREVHNRLKSARRHSHGNETDYFRP